MNEGGPGGSGIWGTRLGPPALHMYQLFNSEMDIVVPSHRGTGWSSPLGCPQEKDPNFLREIENPGGLFNECKKYVVNKFGNFLKFLNPTEAARDIYNVAESLRESKDEKIVIYGISYGAFLMNRYMTVYPNSKHLVILDSIASPKILQFSRFDEGTNRAGEFALNLCQKDSFCGEKLKNPNQELKQLFLHFGGNHCPEFFKTISKSDFKLILYRLIQTQPYGMSYIIPPLIIRLKRCNAVDKIIIKKFIKFFTVGAKRNDEYRGFSDILFIHISNSEMLFNGTLLSLKKIQEIEETLSFSTRSSIMARVMKDHWIEEYQDEFFEKFAETRQPFLLLHGGLDPQTPFPHAPYYFQKVKRTEFQHFVTFPFVVHGTIFHYHKNCVHHTMVNFVRNPTEKPDIRCIEEMPNVDFQGKRLETREISNKIFGIENMWEGI
jgi:pimeloyl-ACP methyl ester carboxylesterase